MLVETEKLRNICINILNSIGVSNHLSKLVTEDLIDNDTMLIDDVWEEEHHIPMKFNRMIIYPSYMWHSAVVKKGWYKDVPRVSMSGFIFPDCLNVNINES